MPVLCDGHFNGAAQAAPGDGLLDVSISLGLAGARQCATILVGGEIDHRYVQLLAHLIRDFDSIHFPFQMDVHQNQVGRRLADQLERSGAGIGRAGNGISGRFEARFQVGRDESFVFDDNDLRFRGGGQLVPPWRKPGQGRDESLDRACPDAVCRSKDFSPENMRGIWLPLPLYGGGEMGSGERWF